MSKPWDGKWERVGEAITDKSGHGRPYLARRVGEAEPKFVIKELKRQKDVERRQMMCREVNVIQGLDHSQIAKCVDSNVDRQGDLEVPLYLVTEYIPGPTLEQFVDGKPQPSGVAVEITLGLLEVLEYCHSHKVVHRDIKPENIILRDARPNGVVLIDFGLSFNEEAGPESLETAHAPMGNQFIQLPEYHVHGDARLKRDFRSDLASVVGVFYFLLTGRPPGSLSDAEGKAPQDRTHALEIIGGMPSKQAARARRIFQRGFQHNLSHRWETAGLLREELQLLTSEGPTALPSFEEQLEALNREQLEEPEYKSAERYEQIVANLSLAFPKLIKRMTEKMAALQFANGGGMFGASDGRIIGSLQVRRKFGESARLVTVAISLQRRDGVIVLVGSVAGKGRDVKACGLFDQEADELLQKAMEQFLINALKESFTIADTPEESQQRNGLFGGRRY